MYSFYILYFIINVYVKLYYIYLVIIGYKDNRKCIVFGIVIIVLKGNKLELLDFELIVIKDLI